MIRPLFTRRRVQVLSSASILSLCLYIYHFLATSDARRSARISKPQPTADTHPPHTPTDYAAPTSESTWCQERFGLRFLENMRNFTGSYCNHQAKSSLDCFWSETAKGRLDTTCFARGAIFDPERKIFHIDCPLRAARDNARGLPRVPEDMHAYWYDTGPLQILNKSLLLNGGAAPRPDAERITILVKREGPNNLWHSLMEIMSLSWSLDSLQMSSTETGAAYLSPSQMNSTQIVLVDDFDLGPYIELWRLFAQMPIRRLSELDAEEPPSNIVVPLVGGSNPLWQGDWVELSCTEASLVSTFVRRVLDLYKISDADAEPASTGGSDADIVVTFVDRKGARELVDQDAHMEALRSAVPHMKLSVVDFASMPLHQQFQVARHTDVLLGVHGAGLTHSMFMKPGAVLVEVLPADFAHKGFRNLAQMLGHRYFRTHAKPAAPKTRRDWQQDPVEIDQ
ncbi:hypothetical protein G3M48_004297 [Beauveria asiatica]|uniref:EGF domain-specific O-linked N-acetylglucosamine transferase n=1 Tax=Beauveria asiatica TaxID=1069075 RepID=A0AAW0RUE7_9HYPO